MSPRTVFISGANRGLGLGIVRELLKNSKIENIIAGARNVANAAELQQLAKNSNSRLHLVRCDVSSDDSIQEAVDGVQNVVGSKGLNVLINNAGMIEEYGYDSKPNRQAVMRCIDVNAVSALLTSQHFLPLLQKAASHVPGTELSAKRAAIVNIGSDCSSQTLNKAGEGLGLRKELLAYKMSKVAMLSYARTLVADFQADNIPILVATIHPGWVLTDMGGPNAEITIDNSVSKIVNNLSNLNSSHHGLLLSRDLEVMPF